MDIVLELGMHFYGAVIIRSPIRIVRSRSLKQGLEYIRTQWPLIICLDWN